jgi:hypothetical protein
VISDGQHGQNLRKQSVRLPHLPLRCIANGDTGPIGGSFPLLSLRTNKADVVVGVDREVAERLDQSEEKWRVSGR